jgi:hypothetical protein
MRTYRPLQELASSFEPSGGASFHNVVVDALARILLEADDALTLLDERSESVSMAGTASAQSIRRDQYRDVPIDGVAITESR